MRRVLLVLATLVAMAVLIPLSVLATVAMGMPARHWSGVHLNDIRWDGDGDADTQPPAGTPLNHPYVPDDVTEVAGDLGFDPGGDTASVSETADGVHGCVSVVVVRLDNATFDRLRRDRDAVCVVYSPRERVLTGGGGTYPPQPPARRPGSATYWSWSGLLGSYWVLLTGFPLHIGAMAALAALAWASFLLVRRVRQAHRPPSAPVPEPDLTGI